MAPFGGQTSSEGRPSAFDHTVNGQMRKTNQGSQAPVEDDLAADSAFNHPATDTLYQTHKAGEIGLEKRSRFRSACIARMVWDVSTGNIYERIDVRMATLTVSGSLGFHQL